MYKDTDIGDLTFIESVISLFEETICQSEMSKKTMILLHIIAFLLFHLIRFFYRTVYYILASSLFNVSVEDILFDGSSSSSPRVISFNF